MNVLVLVGSSRPNSFNAQLADAAVATLPEGTSVERFDRLHELPFYTDAADDNPAAAVEELRAAVARADALVIATPEYNASVPAVLKNAIDWASRPYGESSILGKPVAVLSASPTPGGGASAREHLVAILTRARALPLTTTFGLVNAHEALVAGEPVDSATTAALAELVGELVGTPVGV